MNTAIQIKDLTKSYNDFQLSNINLTLPSGCIMGLIGENGAGKSTTIKSILGLTPIDSGQISVLGLNMSSDEKKIKEQLGVVLDENCFPENLNAKDINHIMPHIFDTWSSQTFCRYQTQFSLPDKKPIKQYSRGMKMKLSIAVALSHNSNLLILDEATSGLDPLAREELQEVFLEYIQDENHSILISSHILSDLEKICDYITFIHQGKIILSDSKDEMLESFGIVNCSHENLKTIDPAAIHGVRSHQFGVEVLVSKKLYHSQFPMDAPSLEDIMLFHVKENLR